MPTLESISRSTPTPESIITLMFWYICEFLGEGPFQPRLQFRYPIGIMGVSKRIKEYIENCISTQNTDIREYNEKRFFISTRFAFELSNPSVWSKESISFMFITMPTRDLNNIMEFYTPASKQSIRIPFDDILYQFQINDLLLDQPHRIRLMLKKGLFSCKDATRAAIRCLGERDMFNILLIMENTYSISRSSAAMYYILTHVTVWGDIETGFAVRAYAPSAFLGGNFSYYAHGSNRTQILDHY